VPHLSSSANGVTDRLLKQIDQPQLAILASPEIAQLLAHQFDQAETSIQLAHQDQTAPEVTCRPSNPTHRKPSNEN